MSRPLKLISTLTIAGWNQPVSETAEVGDIWLFFFHSCIHNIYEANWGEMRFNTSVSSSRLTILYILHFRWDTVFESTKHFFFLHLNYMLVLQVYCEKQQCWWNTKVLIVSFYFVLQWHLDVDTPLCYYVIYYNCSMF